MIKRGFMFTTCTIFIVVILLLFCSCRHNDDLPDGAEYLEPIWFENLTEYCTGNYNRISEFKNGYSTVRFAQMGEYWSVSDEKNAVINKTGEFVLEPLDGDLYIEVIDDKSFYIQDNDNFTSKVVDVNNNVIGSFNGMLSGGDDDDGEIFNKDGVACLHQTNASAQGLQRRYATQGLAKKSGQVIVQCDYFDIISNVTDKHIVFLNDKEGKSADVYKPNGSFSHSIHLDYKITDYENGLLKISSDDGYGVCDIYGNIIAEPTNDKAEILSEKHIIVSEKNSKKCKLLNNKGKTIKTLDLVFYSVSEMNDDVFMLADFKNTYLISSKGEILNEYEDYRYPKYCGDGIFSLVYNVYNREYLQLIDGTTGDFIGEKYNDKNDIKFNEGYAVVEDLEGNTFVIDKDGNKYCEGYEITGNVSDRVVRITADKTAGIICLPPQK